MASRKNFQSKSKKHDKDRYNIYDAAFENPIKSTDNSNIIRKNLSKWVEFCAFIRWLPDVFNDMLTPKEGTRI